MKKEFGEQVKAMRDYSTTMYSAYKRIEYMKEEVLSQGFISALRPHTLRTWNAPMVVERKALLIERGIFLDPNRECLRIEAIIDILYRKCHVSTNDNSAYGTEGAIEQKYKMENAEWNYCTNISEKTGIEKYEFGNKKPDHEEGKTPTTTPKTVRGETL